MINDADIYIKILLDDGYHISSSDDKIIIFCKYCYKADGYDSYFYDNYIELSLDNDQIFMINYVDRDYYGGKHISELDFINKNKDKIRDLKLRTICG